jgi:hypothetical protein
MSSSSFWGVFMLPELYKAILSSLKVKFPEFNVFDEYPKSKKASQAPAIHVEMVEIEPSEEQNSSGELNLVTHWEARILLDARHKGARLAIREIALGFCAFLHQNHFDQPNVSGAKIKNSFDDGLDPEDQTYEAWLVEWSHLVTVGNSVLHPGQAFRIPEHVFAGFEPETGSLHREKYDEVT